MIRLKRNTVIYSVMSLALISGGFLGGLVGCRNLAEAQSVPAAGAPSSLKEDSINLAGRSRSFLIYLPSAYDGRTPLPLVIAFHGGGGNAVSLDPQTGLTQKAEAEGFIVVYPNGSGRRADTLLTWNAEGCCAYAMVRDVDDVGFTRALIDHVEATLAVDSERIYATGFSNGGMMAYRVGVELSDRIAAIAPVAGAMFNTTPQPTQPVSVLIIHGTEDEAVPYQGGMSDRDRVAQAMSLPFLSVEQTALFWQGANECGSTPVVQQQGQVEGMAYPDCESGAEVLLYTIQGGNHAWPGGEKARAEGDLPNQDLNATDLIWSFFARHTRSGS